MVLKPTEKSPGIKQFLDAIVGETNSRENALSELRCLSEPIGCGQPIGNPEEHFRDNLSVREYRISGLCQKCQDAVYGSGCCEDDDDA